MYPESPCIAQCKLNDEDVCIGCKRTIEEIVNWRSFSIEQKKGVFTRLSKLVEAGAPNNQQ
ncbi:DUF1289 domain-containing protein [Alteromonas sp. MTD1]|uniref:DUF1289 domain-containing protein n=1 Tax=Alteromonas sp. MTD1 TaxID=3057962 RepID=UPI0036F255BB